MLFFVVHISICILTIRLFEKLYFLLQNVQEELYLSIYKTPKPRKIPIYFGKETLQAHIERQGENM